MLAILHVAASMLIARTITDPRWPPVIQFDAVVAQK